MYSFKKYLLLFIPLVCFTLNANAQYANAVQYLEAINQEYNGITTASWDYTRTILYSKSARATEKKRKKLISSIETAEKNIKKIGPWEGNKDFRDAVLGYLKTSYNVLIKDYENLLTLEDNAEKSYEAMEKYLKAKKEANDKLAVAQEDVQKELESFCLAHKIKLIEEQTEISRKLSLANEVYQYYNNMYMLFFKANILEVKIIELIEKKDHLAVKKETDNLNNLVEDGLVTLKNYPNYKTDASLISATKNAFVFYVEETEKDFPFIYSFLKEMEEFEKFATDLNANTNRTQADVDLYNKRVNEINVKSQEFNKRVNIMGEKRAQFINQWNQASTTFIERHVPK